MPLVFIDAMNAAIDPVTMIDAPACRCLRLACTRLSTPTRSTSTASTNACGGRPAVSGQMPALATTMSRWPNSATPAIDRGGQRRAVADVGDLGVRALALLLDQPGGLVEVLGPRERVLVGLDVFADVHGDDVGALGGQQSARATAPDRARLR